jgi:hypothetical protein
MDATLLRSYIWKDVGKICLTRNMRAQSDPWFLDYLHRIDNGSLKKKNHSKSNFNNDRLKWLF